jgi:hypothetical protein
MRILVRRVQQICKSYAETGREPAIGEYMGRPKKPSLMRKRSISLEMPTSFFDLGPDAGGCS